MEAVVFDMDGVIVDSVSYKHSRRTKVVREDFGLDEVDTGELIGLNTDDKYEYLVETADLDVGRDEFRERFDANVERVYTEEVELLSGLVPTLERLRDRGVEIGLGSASSRRRVDLVVDRFDLDEWFDATVSADDVSGGSKPDPDIYLRVAADLGVDPASCVAVEDSSHGVAAATTAGMYCLGYNPPDHPGAAVREADELLTSPDELWNRLRDLAEPT